MATLEERMQALEQEHTQLKKTIDLQTIAIRALVSKEAFEKLQNTVENIKTSQESLKLDFERQEKRIVHFERQTNDQFTDIKADITTLKTDTATIKEQLAL